MTAYQQIENELMSLGWTAEQGRGDHMKFTKDGGATYPIVVALSLKGNARAVKNTYADIRRVEPNFSLGRPVRKKTSGETGAKEPQPAWVPEYLSKGSAVRWTTPEKRDFSKMQDPASIMNCRYIVTDYCKKDDGTILVTICQAEGDHEPFSVNASQLESWELKRCPHCSREFPASLFRTPEGLPSPVCPMCASSVKVRTATKTDYTGTVMDALPEKKRRELAKQVDALAASIKGTRESAKLQAVSEIIQGKKQKTPYVAWRSFQRRLLSEIILEQGLKKESQKYKSAEKNVTDIAYVTRTVRGTKVFEVTTRDWETVKAIWSRASVFYEEFDEVNGGTPVLLVCSPAHDFRQWVPDPRRGASAAAEKLAAALPPEESDSMSRARADSGLPPFDEVKGQLDRIFSLIRNGDSNMSLKDAVTVKVWSELPAHTSEEDFETAPSHLHLDVIVDDIAFPNLFEGMLKTGPAMSEGLPKTVTILPVSRADDAALREKYSFGYELFSKAAEAAPQPAAGEKEKQETLTKTKTEYHMEEILDATNPSSADASAGALTTRALLRELKARGIQFEGLSVLVRKSIDYDAI